MSIGVTKIALISTPLSLYGYHHHRNRPAVVQRLGLVRLGEAACIYTGYADCSLRLFPFRGLSRFVRNFGVAPNADLQGHAVTTRAWPGCVCSNPDT